MMAVVGYFPVDDYTNAYEHKQILRSSGTDNTKGSRQLNKKAIPKERDFSTARVWSTLDAYTLDKPIRLKLNRYNVLVHIEHYQFNTMIMMMHMRSSCSPHIYCVHGLYIFLIFPSHAYVIMDDCTFVWTLFTHNICSYVYDT